MRNQDNNRDQEDERDHGGRNWEGERDSNDERDKGGKKDREMEGIGEMEETNEAKKYYFIGQRHMLFFDDKKGFGNVINPFFLQDEFISCSQIIK